MITQNNKPSLQLLVLWKTASSLPCEMKSLLEGLQGPLEESEHDSPSSSQSPLPPPFPQAHLQPNSKPPLGTQFDQPPRASINPSSQIPEGNLIHPRGSYRLFTLFPEVSPQEPQAQCPLPPQPTPKHMADGGLRSALQGSVHQAATEGRVPAQSGRRQWLQQE